MHADAGLLARILHGLLHFQLRAQQRGQVVAAGGPAAVRVQEGAHVVIVAVEQALDVLQIARVQGMPHGVQLGEQVVEGRRGAHRAAAIAGTWRCSGGMAFHADSISPSRSSDSRRADASLCRLASISRVCT